MPNLSVTKTYQDGDILTEADLDNVRESIQNWANTTKLDDDNLQDNGISASKLGIDDGEFVEFGTGNDGAIGVTSDDLYIKNVTLDRDIIFQVNDGGVTTEVLRLDGSSGTATVAATDETNTLSIVNVAKLKEYLPAGMIMAYGKNSAPTGYLLCDGSAVSRTTYAALFTAIGTTAGSGDGSTTFNVPDLRGRFLRGRDATSGNDPDAGSRTAINTGGNTGDNVFSLQGDAVSSHRHELPLDNVQVQSGSGQDVYRAGILNPIYTGYTGSETRPKNVYVNYIIKY